MQVDSTGPKVAQFLLVCRASTVRYRFNDSLLRVFHDWQRKLRQTGVRLSRRNAPDRRRLSAVIEAIQRLAHLGANVSPKERTDVNDGLRFHPHGEYFAIRRHPFAFVFKVFYLATCAMTLPFFHIARDDRALVGRRADSSSTARSFLLQNWDLLQPNADFSPTGENFVRSARDIEHSARTLTSGIDHCSPPTRTFSFENGIFAQAPGISLAMIRCSLDRDVTLPLWSPRTSSGSTR